MAVQNHLLSNTVLIKPDENDDSDSSLQGETLKVQVNTKSEAPPPLLSPGPGAAASSADGYGPLCARPLWSWWRDVVSESRAAWGLQLASPPRVAVPHFAWSNQWLELQSPTLES